MGVKIILKKILGTDLINFIYGEYRMLKGNHRVVPHFSIIEEREKLLVKTFSVRNKHVFCGYYDVDPLSKDGSRILVQTVRRWANPLKHNSGIGVIDVETGKYTEFCKSSAWCWQQGSRLRWSNENNYIYYNDLYNGKYCTVKYNIKEKKIVTRYTHAFYDIDKQERYGVTLNFSRLQRLRAGYGYGRLRDQTEGHGAPKNTGIKKVDLHTGEEVNLISLCELSKKNDTNGVFEHYINHVSISPDGAKILFFHVVISDENVGWIANLSIIDSDGTNFISLGEGFSVSHYTWIDNENIFVTENDKNRKLKYVIYNVITQEKRIIKGENLDRDGHPTWINDNFFISDTYPDMRYIQKVFLHNNLTGEEETIIELYSDPRLINEQRCDLHPKVCVRASNKYIFIDTTYKRCKRNIVMIKMNYRKYFK